MPFRFLCASLCFAAAIFAVVDARALALSAEQPSASIPTLLAAHTANLRDSAISLQLGVELERAGDLKQAEQILLEAASYDHQYQPAWALANFYLRRNQVEPFWQWSRRAAELSYDDGRPLLRLASAVEDDPSVVVGHLGSRPVLLRTYLDILIGQDRRDTARQVAAMLAEFHDPADRPRFEALQQRFGGSK